MTNNTQYYIEQFRKNLFQFIGVVQTVDNGKDLENYANGFMKEFTDTITAVERDKIQQVKEMLGKLRIPHEYKCRADKGEMTADCTCDAIEFNYPFNQALDTAIDTLTDEEGKEK